jgi:hypothetical protein
MAITQAYTLGPDFDERKGIEMTCFKEKPYISYEKLNQLGLL